jgi:elongation factor P
MIKAGQIERGTALLIKGKPFVCIDREFVNPGKGSAFVRLKLRNPGSGQILAETMKTQDNAEEITVDDRDCQYLYNDGENFHLMMTDTYDQIEVPMSTFPDYELLLKDGETYRCTFWETELLDLQLPPKVVYLVEDAEEAVKGDTVQGATKYVTTECGLKVKCPIFIKKGEKIRVNTETKEYIERVNS